MNEVIEQIKLVPLGVKAAVLFLLAVYVLFTIAAPVHSLFFAVGCGIVASVFRIAKYLEKRK